MWTIVDSGIMTTVNGNQRQTRFLGDEDVGVAVVCGHLVSSEI